jgi:cytochrome c556
MFRLFGTLLVCVATLFFAGISFGYSSVEDAVQKRIVMFKSSGANIKKLSKFIRSGDINASIELVDFHVKWSKDMHLLFPVGSEASISNGSDASSDIWSDSTGFRKRVDQYHLSAKELREALKSKNISSINENFDGLVGACKSCHKQFRN